MARSTGRFPRSHRLLDSRDFQRVLRQGRRRATDELVVVSLARSASGDRSKPGPGGARRVESTDQSRRPGPPSMSRLGITASRKVGNAVERNRFKRRVREWFRTHREDLGEPMDVVIIARRSGARLESPALADRLERLIGSARPADSQRWERSRR